jgi:hypothetical protein
MAGNALISQVVALGVEWSFQGTAWGRGPAGRPTFWAVPGPNLMQSLGLTLFRGIKYDPRGSTACGVKCARTSS